MNARILPFVFVFIGGVIVGNVATPLIGEHVVMAQTHKPIYATRLYTGPDNQTHAEEVELKFTSSGVSTAVSSMLPVSGAELHRSAAGTFQDWHRAPRRQYVITLSGRGEIEVAGGKKIFAGPGHIDLVEDTTGKGHISRELGTEDRVTLQLPISDQPGR